MPKQKGAKTFCSSFFSFILDEARKRDMHANAILHALFTRRSLARLLSTLICSTLIVVRPFGKFGGQSAFLALTVKELVFSAQQNLAQQIEALFLHLTGGMFAIAMSLLGNYLSTLAEPDSSLARAVPAIFLTLIAFTAGWLKSALPRLTLSCRIACLVSIFMLTDNPAQPNQNITLQATQFMWIILTGAISSLVACFILLRWSSAQLAQDVGSALTSLHQCLQAHLDTSFGVVHLGKDMDRLHEKLLKQAVGLSGTYSQASFELRIGRVGVKSIKPLIGTVEHLRRELAWGITFPRDSCEAPDVDKRTFEPLHNVLLTLGDATLHALLIVRLAVLKCYDVPSSNLGEMPSDALLSAQERLSTALSSAQMELNHIGDVFDVPHNILSRGSHRGMPQRTLNMCLFAVSLMQMAHESRQALRIAENMVHTYNNSSLKLWYPRFTRAWLGVTPSTIVLEERTAQSLDDDDTPVNGSRTTLSYAETKQGVMERDMGSGDDFWDDDESKGHLFRKNSKRGKKYSLQWFQSLPACLWNRPWAMSWRLKLSKWLRSVQHSSHLKHAIKNAAGVALLAIPAFYPAGSAARTWFSSFRGQWMLISFVWVLETNSGATWRVGYLRLSGTILGAIYAFIASTIARTNPYAIVVLATAVEVPISWIVTASTFPSMGVVANVTLPPILFVPYLTPGMPAIRVAWVRAVTIAIGIVAALLLNSGLYPRLCRVMFLDNACRTVGLLNQLYTSLSRDLFQHVHSTPWSDKRRRLKIEWNVRNVLHRMSILVATMNDELSLVPKPMRRYRQIIVTLQRLLDLLTGLRKIREHIPRKHTVIAVAEERREFVSCMCVCLFACEQVFGARQPLPQFLPSARQALGHLQRQVGEQIRNTREHSRSGSTGLSVVYALAETNLLADIVDAIEELLMLCRQLFGTTAWLDHQSLDLMAMVSVHEEVGSMRSPPTSPPIGRHEGAGSYFSPV